MRTLICTLFLVATLPGAGTASPLPPKPTRYVTDHASVFAPDRLSALNEKLASFERATSDQVIVYVDRSLPEGTTLEELGAAAMREWGVGQKGKSNGVILFIFVGDRRIRLEVGYGLEGVLPDARARQITSDVMKPLFLKGDYAGGIEAGVAAILAAATHESYAGSSRAQAESLAARRAEAEILANRARFWERASVVIVLGGVGLVILLMVRMGLREQRRHGRSYGSGGTYTPSSGGSYSSSSDSGSSSGSSDFSGGGGDSGGGGTSDSW